MLSSFSKDLLTDPFFLATINGYSGTYHYTATHLFVNEKEANNVKFG
jgi:hypothetical protein